MNDLRHDPDELPARGYSVVDEWVLRHAADPRVLPTASLRTVPAPNLRCPDCRTSDDKTRAELVRIVDALQALTLRVDVLIEDQARTIAELTAYIRDHSEADE